MSGPIANPSESVLDRYAPPAVQWARDAAAAQLAAEAAPAPGSPGRSAPPAAVAGLADQAPSNSAPRGIVPGRDPQMFVLTSLPQPGEVLPVDQSSGLGRALSNVLGGTERQHGGPPRTSDWSDSNDMRVVLPVMRTRSGPVTSMIETLPGRDQHWATVRIADRPANPALNWDGFQAAARVGLHGPLVDPNFGNQSQITRDPNPMQVEWAEFRVGVEGLVFTGQVAQGSFRVSGFDLQQGFFKTKLEGLGQWAGQNLAVAIPLGIVGAGVAALAVNRVANWTNQDVPLPISVTVFERNGFSIRPTVRPIFGTTEFIRFGGADLGLGYRIPQRLDIQVRPGWNLDPSNGAVGPRVGARVAVPFTLPGNIPGTAGLEADYNQQTGFSAYVGAGFTF